MSPDTLELVFQDLLKAADDFPLPSESSGCSCSLHTITFSLSIACFLAWKSNPWHHRCQVSIWQPLHTPLYCTQSGGKTVLIQCPAQRFQVVFLI